MLLLIAALFGAAFLFWLFCVCVAWISDRRFWARERKRAMRHPAGG
jgi:hypothetical protein